MRGGKRGCPHTQFKRNQKIIAILEDGSKFTDRFIEKKSGAVFLRSSGRIAIKNIRAMGVFRNDTIGL